MSVGAKNNHIKWSLVTMILVDFLSLFLGIVALIGLSIVIPPKVAVILVILFVNPLARLLRTIITYTAILLYPASPSYVIYRLYNGSTEDKVSMYHRDVICSPKHLEHALTKGPGRSTDPHAIMTKNTGLNFTFMSDDEQEWKPRRSTLLFANRKMLDRIKSITKRKPFAVGHGTTDLYRQIIE
jgi:hypothetical protein